MEKEIKAEGPWPIPQPIREAAPRAVAVSLSEIKDALNNHLALMRIPFNARALSFAPNGDLSEGLIFYWRE